MTVERLRQHLFGGPQVPFWNYDPDQITAGVEIEYFIAQTYDDGSFKLATKDEYLEVMEHLKNDFGYKDRKLLDQPGRVSRDTESGFIAIKPDFAWHILEISLPPRKHLAELRKLLDQVFMEIDTALSKVKLSRLDRASLPDVPDNFDLVALDRLGQISETFISNPTMPTAIPVFPALITATHVHLNVFNEDAYKALKSLYETDAIISRKFTRPAIFRGQQYQDLRGALYKETLGPNYLMCDRPSVVPASLQDVCDLMNRSSKLFPHDRFYPVRDMTLIRGSKYGTLEFRSSCSFVAAESIIEIVKWRITQVLAAYSHVHARENINSLNAQRYSRNKKNAG